MSRPTAAQLHQFAQEERTRRKAARQAAGQGLSDRAQWDDVIWSNIQQMAGRFAGDPAAMQRTPWYWTKPEIEIMMNNAKATAIKAETSLDHAKPANLEKIVNLWHIYRWLRRPGDYGPAAPQLDAVTSAARLLGAEPADFPHHWKIPGKGDVSTGQMLFLAADLRFAQQAEDQREAA